MNFYTVAGLGLVILALIRLLMVIQAAIGFSIFTLTITYILSVYSSIIKRNTFALNSAIGLKRHNEVKEKNRE